MKKLLTLVFVGAALMSCTDDDIKTEQSLGNGPKVLGFATPFESVAYFEDLGAITREFPVNVIGSGNGQLSSTDIEVSYEIDQMATTAVEGVEFDFSDTSGKVIIPAGSSFGMFPLIVNTGNFNPTAKTELVLNLTTSSPGTTVGAQYNRLRIVFVGCLSQLAGTYTTLVERNDGFSTTYFNEDITLVGINTFKTTTTGTWAAGTIAPDQGYNFIDICGEITISRQGLAQGYYSNEVYGIDANGLDGTVADNDNFTATYEITFAAGNRQYTNTYVRD